MTPLRVLAWPADANRTGNPYNRSLSEALRALGVIVDEFTPGRLARGRYDVWHAHWPDGALGRGGTARAAAGAGALIGIADLARARGTRLVWTVHNLRAHRPIRPAVERAFWRAWTGRVDGSIHLSATARLAALDAFPRLRERPSFVVPHPHYRDAYPRARSREEARTSLGLPPGVRVVACVGHIRRYKAVPELIRAFRGIPDPTVRLVVAGRPEDHVLRAAIEDATERDSRVLHILDVLSEDQLATVIGAADLVALPYAEVLNSGAALLALSLDRPVLVPGRGAMSDLREEVGPEWVYVLDDAVGPGNLEAALASVATRRPRAPAPLEAYDPARVAAATLNAYREVLARPRGRG